MMKNFQENIQLIENGVRLLDTISDVNEIYHYTTIAGLQGILKGKNFWVSHSYFLNDSSEIKYTYRLVVDVLKEIMDNEQDDKVIKMYNILKIAVEEVEIREVGAENIVARSGSYRPSEYILSFSLNKDSLSVWSAFTEGGGYNIGINFHEYFRELQKQNFLIGPIPGKVIYNLEKQREIISSKIDEYKKLYLKHMDNFDQEKEKVFVSNFTSSIRLYANFFKNPKFYSDEEFRIVFYNYRNGGYIPPSYRVKGDVLIPYINSNKGGDSTTFIPLKSITIGPTNQSDIAKEGLAYFLSDLGYNVTNIELLSSDIPLRY